MKTDNWNTHYYTVNRFRTAVSVIERNIDQNVNIEKKGQKEEEERPLVSLPWTRDALSECPATSEQFLSSVTIFRREPVELLSDEMSDLDPHRLLGLCASLHNLDLNQLQIKINNFLAEASGSGVVFLSPILTDTDEVMVQVIMDQALPQEMRFPAKIHVLGVAASTNREAVTLADLSEDQISELSELLGYQPDTYLSICVKHPENQMAALLACLVNFPTAANLDHLVQITQYCCSTVLGTILNTIAYEKEKRLKIQCQSLLTVAKNLFTHLDNITDLLREIMMEAQKLTNAERCSLFLLDKEHHELVAKVFDGYPAKGENEAPPEIRIAENQGIAGHVAMTGQLLNIKDAYSHPLFYKGVDEATGFITRNILCIPIKDESEVVGIAQLCNKINGMQFTPCDEEIAIAFSIFCGISIIHSLMYKKVQDAQSRSKLSNELMMHHMKVSPEDLVHLVETPMPTLSENFSLFSFIPRSIPTDATPTHVLAMFEDLGLSQRLRIGSELLAKFVLLVKKGYRDPPYHNWMHAFTVTHFAYLLLKNLKLMENGYITELEGLALLVACLCHDLDHRGTTNSFQLASNSVLAGLYSSEGSVMERHHLSQAMCILNTDGCNILQNLSEMEYRKVLDLIRDIILATDLAQHLRIIGQHKMLVTSGYDKSNEAHHSLLLSLIMTCCDLSDQTKKWTDTKKIAILIYQEFFSQGDLEKAMGNRPIEMMDREKACIPTLQLQFLDDIVMPAYEALCNLFGEAESLLTVLKTNYACWEKALEVYSNRKPQGSASIHILEDEALEVEVMKALGLEP